ncbi:MAG: leucine--tRNA ligase [Deltaproteobacteria bacterium]|jgi:leucyl-tRNA synthetase|nr:leucine--tRNA ligase [Deltaproteobacteria bacterium]
MTDKIYNAKDIESKWQNRWEETHAFKVDEKAKGEKYYLLEMLPYPSGRIHMGHVRNYTIGDVAARYRMMRGVKVLHPMGWDAFGMPAENAAIQRKVHPADWTYKNIDYMRGQMKRLGFSYDWEREFATCDSSYYKWEQLIFTRMFEKGWVYKKTSQINWCPSCKTVLANEQVSAGCCWRCDSGVEMKSMSQWYFRITDYAEELLIDIDDKLQGWPERVKTMQREWIGKSHGANIDFPIEGSDQKIQIFTTRPDTLFGVTFMSLAWEHPLVKEFAKKNGKEKEVEAFIEKSSKIDHKARLEDTYEKDGVFTGAYCLNPLTGDKVPVYAANFVLMEYGTGAVMAVPGHDQRDFEFAKKYNLPIKIVIQPIDEALDPSTMDGAWEGAGTMINSGEFDGLKNKDGIKAVSEHLKKNKLGGSTVTYRLKDWCLSRQRYWGTPIPIIHCDKCGAVPVPEKELPVELPHDVEFTGVGGSPLSRVASFVDTDCPKCGSAGKRETDTMDTFVESSWYMLRYACPRYDKAPVDPKMMKYWLPIDQYIGGIEHAVGHLIYFRYFTKVMRDLGMHDLDEPCKNLMTQGMVYKDGAKMSKSKGNVVDPDDMIAKYGADTMRLFSLFAAPPEKDLEWNDKGVEGSHRFLLRVWRLVMDHLDIDGETKESPEAARWRNKTVKKVTEDIERFHFNTAIAAVMEYVNYLYGVGVEKIDRLAVETLVLLISPLAPHAAEELWEKLGNGESILGKSWPTFDEAMIASDTLTIVVQVNGKVRERLDIPADMSDEDVKQSALSNERVISFMEGKEPRKVIVIPKKLVNIVL